MVTYACRSVSMFGADHVDRPRVLEYSPAVKILEFDVGEMIPLLRIGSLPCNGISNNLQAKPIKNRNIGTNVPQSR